jgi:hypothetical protein
MQARITERTVEQALAAVWGLDLEPIRLRVMDPKRGRGWTSDHADSVEREYRSYLTMLVKHPEAIESIVVSEDVDEFWHTHILHTMKYTDDCQRVFGTYLHHNPQVVARNSADIERTWVLYQQEFAAMCSAAIRPAMCSAAVQAQDAAMCSAAIRPAMCSAAVQAQDAAMCSAAIRPAMCSAAVQAQDAAMCSAAIRPAMCSAAIRAQDAAMCSAAIRAQDAAMCSAAIRPAMCSAAIRPAMCSAAVRAGDSALA